MSEFSKLKSKHKIDAKSFELVKQDYYARCNRVNNPDFSVERSRLAFDALCDRLVDILRISAVEAKMNESAGFYRTEETEVIPRVCFITDTTQINITLGLFREFYIVTAIKHARNIKFMKDDYWSMLFELSTIGEFGFKENEKPDKNIRRKYPQLFNKRGNYFKLLRNYFLLEADYGTNMELGYITVSWSSETKFEILIPKICRAFEIMYEINFRLWKHDNKATKF